MLSVCVCVCVCVEVCWYIWVCVGDHVCVYLYAGSLYQCMSLDACLGFMSWQHVISGMLPTWDSAHSRRLFSAVPLGYKAASTEHWYHTQSHYPDTEPTSPCPIRVIPNSRLGGGLYKWSKSWTNMCLCKFVCIDVCVNVLVCWCVYCINLDSCVCVDGLTSWREVHWLHWPLTYQNTGWVRVTMCVDWYFGVRSCIYAYVLVCVSVLVLVCVSVCEC